jgi:hypothetical protein
MGSNPASKSVAGDGWFKVFHDGYHDGDFCTERIRKNNNKLTFSIPKDLAGYVIRRNSLGSFY